MTITMESFSYAPQVPKGYECGRCHATGVKLWRDYNTFLEHQVLLCKPCVEIDRADHISDMKKVWEKLKSSPPVTDQVGGMIPAVPTEDGSTFWGYSSVPDAGVRWWQSLPEVKP